MSCIDQLGLSCYKRIEELPDFYANKFKKARAKLRTHSGQCRVRSRSCCVPWTWLHAASCQTRSSSCSSCPSTKLQPSAQPQNKTTYN